MKPAEFFERNLVPTGIVLAFNEARAINEVLLYGSYRVRITREMTRAEFMEALRDNDRYEHSVKVETQMVGSETKFDNAVERDEPPPEFTHFYAAELL